jgi:cytochrome c oxidase subunit 4
MSTAETETPTPTTPDTEEGSRPHPEGGSHGNHPSDGTYIVVALVLALATAIEVGMSYWKVKYFTNFTLLILAIFKFSLVVMFFMHLRFDNKVLRRLFLTGIVVALSVYFIVMLTFGLFVG